MSDSAVTVDLSAELSASLDVPKLTQLKQQIFSETELYDQAKALHASWDEGGKPAPRQALAWLLNRHSEVRESKVKGDLADLLRGRSALALGDADGAAESFAAAKLEPWSEYGAAEATLNQGDAEGALKRLRKLEKKHSDDPELHYLIGLALDRVGEYGEAKASYEQALELDEDYPPALFRLAYNHDLRGDDDLALELYERCAELKPAYENALLNLGVLYDDRNQYKKAINCFQRILDTNPNHARARLFKKDAVSSLDMFFDEDQARRADRQNLILSIPVTDFELSVRSRNCLNKMDIRTLGDLVEKTEAELLSYKNFGETSLMEIKEILAKKGLRLGMGRDAVGVGRGATVAERLLGSAASDSPEAGKLLSEFDLSVRVRTAMRNLNIQTLGELAARTSRELLACKNFGQTSLDEVRGVLSKHGISLADEPAPS